MAGLLTVAYVVGFFALFVGAMLYLTYHGVEGEAHSPGPDE